MKLKREEGKWNCAKEVLGWNIGTEDGTISLSEQKLQDLTQLLDIPDTQRRIDWKELERLVGKFCSMYLAVPVEIEHLHHIQSALKQGGGK